MRSEGRSSAGVVAVVGIAATALVGIAGAVTTWVVAREDRTTQVALAHDQRIYDRRATAYVDVLTGMQALSDDLRLLRFEDVPTAFDFQRKQANLRARMAALGSSPALRLYNTMFFGASRTLSAIQGLHKSGAYGSPLARSDLWKANKDRLGFDAALREFQALAAEEVGGTRR